MSLVVWCKSPKAKVLSALAPVMGRADFPIEVVQDFAELPTEGVVLALGSDPLTVLQAVKAVPKNRTITSLRGHVLDVQGRKVMLSYSPGVLESDHGWYVDLLCDMKMATRLYLTGSAEPKFGKYKYVNDFSELIQEIEELWVAGNGKPVDVAHDTETVGSDPLHPGIAGGPGARPAARFVSFQWTAKPGTAHVRYFASRADFDAAMENGLYEQVQWLLTTDKISHRLANGKFDMQWHWFHTKKPGQTPHMECTNFKFDSTLVGNLLDENRSNGLKLHAKIYTDMGGYADALEKKYPKDRMDLVPKEVMLPYAGGDTDVELQVSAAMRQELTQDRRQTAFYVNVLHPAARAFECIERGGVAVDMDAWNELSFQLDQALASSTQKAIKLLGGRLYAKHRDDTKLGGINLTKASLICDFMFSPTGLNLKPKMLTAGGKDGKGEKKPSTSLDHLLMFKDHPEAGPFVSVLEEYGSAAKMKSTYDTGFRAHLRADGRLHPSYFLHVGDKQEDEGGAVTGRLSARDPAFQTVPKHNKWAKLIRRIFMAPPGFLVLEADYSQGELRVVACIANEHAMLEAYQKGMDLHVKTGAGIAGMTYEEVMALKETDEEKYESIRQPAKPANFGLLYGQLAKGFRDYAENNYGVKLTMAQAEDICVKFFQMYPRLPVYHEEYKALAHKFKQVVSPLGRVRHLPLINAQNGATRSSQERKAINSPVQSCLSDMMIWSLGIEWQMGMLKEAPCFGVVHDAQYAYLPEDKAEEYAKRKKEVMENLPFEKVGWKPQLKFIADVKLGPNMADLKKVK